MSWFKKLLPSKVSAQAENKKGVPEGVWTKCDGCSAILYRPELERNFSVCPKCSYHTQMTLQQRIEFFLDPLDQERLAEDIEPVDRLKFKDSKRYKDRLVAAQKQTGEKEALAVVKGKLFGDPLVITVFNFHFIGGSMSAGVGARFVRAVDYCVEHRLPLVCFSASGGARMQEALFSLLQMARTSAALTKLAKYNLPFISVLTDPTMAGVSASLSNLGDIIIAEPGALVGFTGPRVIEQTVREKLPDGFQRSEFLLAHGAIDMIVDRRELRATISRIIKKLMHLPV